MMNDQVETSRLRERAFFMPMKSNDNQFLLALTCGVGGSALMEP